MSKQIINENKDESVFLKDLENNGDAIGFVLMDFPGVIHGLIYPLIKKKWQLIYWNARGFERANYLNKIDTKPELIEYVKSLDADFKCSFSNCVDAFRWLIGE